MKYSFPLVSVVLPVFNGERFLRGAIESVLAQTCRDWELLIVDDGSTDRSPAICDEYAEKDARIRVFHQPNGGVNAARAKGIDNARGEFLIFLDADDALMPDAIAYMARLFQSDTDLVAHGNSDVKLNKEAYAKALWGKGTGPELWGKMFRTTLLKQTDYTLERRMTMGEDLLLNSMYTLMIESAILFSKEVYSVNHNNEASVTRTFKHNWEYEKYYFSKVEDRFLSKCRGWDSYEEIRLLVNKSWLNAMKYVMLDGNRINYKDAEFKEISNYFKTKKQVLGPSERLLFIVKISCVYRCFLNFYLNHIQRYSVR